MPFLRRPLWLLAWLGLGAVPCLSESLGDQGLSEALGDQAKGKKGRGRHPNAPLGPRGRRYFGGFYRFQFKEAAARRDAEEAMAKVDEAMERQKVALETLGKAQDEVEDAREEVASAKQSEKNALEKFRAAQKAMAEARVAASGGPPGGSLLNATEASAARAAQFVRLSLLGQARERTKALDRAESFLESFANGEALEEEALGGTEEANYSAALDEATDDESSALWCSSKKIQCLDGTTWKVLRKQSTAQRAAKVAMVGGLVTWPLFLVGAASVVSQWDDPACPRVTFEKVGQKIDLRSLNLAAIAEFGRLGVGKDRKRIRSLRSELKAMTSGLFACNVLNLNSKRWSDTLDKSGLFIGQATSEDAALQFCGRFLC